MRYYLLSQSPPHAAVEGGVGEDNCEAVQRDQEAGGHVLLADKAHHHRCYGSAHDLSSSCPVQAETAWGISCK